MSIPISARLTCSACESYYDFRTNKDRSCPECGCPASTVVELVGHSRHTVPNPELPEWLAKNADHVSKMKRTVSNRESQRRSRAKSDQPTTAQD